MELAQSNELGRYWVRKLLRPALRLQLPSLLLVQIAARSFEPGETILRELPYESVLNEKQARTLPTLITLRFGHNLLCRFPADAGTLS
jgi:hypothetical protein